MLGRYEDELTEARRGSEQFAQDPDLRNSQIGALAALGRLGEMNRAFEEIDAAQIRGATSADAMLFAARELRAHGHREGSMQLAERTVAWYRGRPVHETAAEEFQRGLARALFCAELWNDSRVIFEKLVNRGSTHVGDIGIIGVAAARAGDRVTASKVADELERLDGTRLFGEQTFYRACIAAALGEKEEATALLREAFSQGQAFGADLHSSLPLDPLWGYPPFQELIKPKG